MSESSSSNGIGFFGLLTIVFIVLKLTKVVSWGWWWVLAPLWAPLTLLSLVFLGVLIFAGIVMLIAKVWK